MGLFDSVKRQLRSVIEWESPNPNALVEVWSENGDEIKNASKLLVKPGQGVLFVYDGKLQAVHAEEGLYELKTANIPFLTTLSRIMQSFESEHKAGVYFFWRTEQLNQKWGTPGPVKYNDPVYKFPVGLRAFGNFSFRITDPASVLANIVGSRATYSLDDARKAITARFVQPLTDLLAESSFSYAEIDKNRQELGETLKSRIAPVLQELGFEICDFRLENTDFDEATQARIAKIADAMADAQAAQAVGLNFAQMQQLEALRDAARNEGGVAGAGVGFGAGIGLGQAMAGAFATQAAGPLIGQAAAQAVAPAPQASQEPAERLRKLKTMLEQNLISPEEFEKKKAEILGSL